MVVLDSAAARTPCSTHATTFRQGCVHPAMGGAAGQLTSECCCGAGRHRARLAGRLARPWRARQHGDRSPVREPHGCMLLSPPAGSREGVNTIRRCGTLQEWLVSQGATEKGGCLAAGATEDGLHADPARARERRDAPVSAMGAQRRSHARGARCSRACCQALNLRLQLTKSTQSFALSNEQTPIAGCTRLGTTAVLTLRLKSRSCACACASSPASAAARERSASANTLLHVICLWWRLRFVRGCDGKRPGEEMGKAQCHLESVIHNAHHSGKTTPC